VGHFLLTQLLLDCLKASAPARVVMVSSKAHRHANDIDFSQVRQATESVGGLKEYSVAKLANLLFSNELARQLQGTGVTTYAVHPGVVATDVWRAMPAPLAWLLKHFMRTAEQGAATSLYAATAPLLATQSGYYYADCQQAETSPTAQDLQLARRLWEQSERWVAID
jgi:NAD(P)-dependent dehydrogenase (short-subunit alcohol dehydrogenase family)